MTRKPPVSSANATTISPSGCRPVKAWPIWARFSEPVRAYRNPTPIRTDMPPRLLVTAKLIAPCSGAGCPAL